jgi:formylglycine-generating enzyme required for sulfatase activity
MQQSIDITDVLTLTGVFPDRMRQLGYRIYQAVAESGQDTYQYVLPPLAKLPMGNYPVGIAATQYYAGETWLSPGRLRFKELQTYQISMYPLTVLEYKCAVDAGIVPAPFSTADMWWGKLQRRPQWPIMLVSWENLQHYLKWLRECSKQAWRLPTADEWEVAASWDQEDMVQRVYPWGNEWDPTLGHVLGGVAEIGRNANKSWYGCYDMIGLVQEWTSSIWSGDVYSHGVLKEDDTDREALRLIYGGSAVEQQWPIRIVDRVVARSGVAAFGLGARLAL